MHHRLYSAIIRPHSLWVLFHWSSDKQHTWLRAHLQSKADPVLPQFSLWDYLMFNQWCFIFLPFIAESLSLKLGPEGACRSIGSLQVHANRNKRRHFPSLFIGIKHAWLGAMSGEKCVSSRPPPVPHYVCSRSLCSLARRGIDHAVQQNGDQAGLQQGRRNSWKQTVIDLCK